MKNRKILISSSIIVTVLGGFLFYVGEQVSISYKKRSFSTSDVLKSDYRFISDIWGIVSDVGLAFAVLAGIALIITLLYYASQKKKRENNAIDSLINKLYFNNQTNDEDSFSLSEKLRFLDKAKKTGLITQEEYNELRKRYINTQ